MPAVGAEALRDGAQDDRRGLARHLIRGIATCGALRSPDHDVFLRRARHEIQGEEASFEAGGARLDQPAAQLDDGKVDRQPHRAREGRRSAHERLGPLGVRKDVPLELAIRAKPLSEALPAARHARNEYGPDPDLRSHGADDHEGSLAIQGVPIDVRQLGTHVVVRQHDKEIAGLADLEPVRYESLEHRREGDRAQGLNGDARRLRTIGNVRLAERVEPGSFGLLPRGRAFDQGVPFLEPPQREQDLVKGEVRDSSREMSVSDRRPSRSGTRRT